MFAQRPATNLRSIRAEIPLQVAQLDAASDSADISNFHASPHIIFSATVSRDGREELRRFDGVDGVEMRSSTLNSMLLNEMKVRKRHSIDWTSIELPTGCGHLEEVDGSERLVIDSILDASFADLSSALQNELASDSLRRE